MPLELQGYSAHVQCGEDVLELYDIKKEDDKTVSCWIASEAGKNFSIHWRDKPDLTTMSVELEVDGRSVARRAQRTSSNVKGSFRGAQDGVDRMRPFSFAPLVLTDDDHVADSTETRCAELGTIRLTMIRVERYVETDKPYVAHDAYDLQPIHEKSKKAGIHAVSFGPAESYSVGNGLTPVHKEKEPFAIFIFRYRPLDLLRANRIAPLPPVDSAQTNSAPASHKRAREDSSHADDLDAANIKSDPDDDDDDEDLTELQQQLAAIQRRIEAKAAKRTKRKIKREISPIRVPSSSSSREPEVIDLT
ncbi:hypothetical protein FKP32DRAFT_1599106 [Trametes sanguinea]|nr:hypothetical protein FKP32DRAFT_1599106 [Trametes sanguinea]